MYPESLSDGDIPPEEPQTDILESQQTRNFLAIHKLLFKLKESHQLSHVDCWYKSTWTGSHNVQGLHRV